MILKYKLIMKEIFKIYKRKSIFFLVLLALSMNLLPITSKRVHAESSIFDSVFCLNCNPISFMSSLGILKSPYIIAEKDESDKEIENISYSEILSNDISYSKLSKSDKKEIFEILYNLNFENFDFRNYEDASLLEFVASRSHNGYMDFNVEYIEEIKATLNEDYVEKGWGYLMIGSKEIDDYIKKVFGVTPKKISIYKSNDIFLSSPSYYKNDYYYILSWECGSSLVVYIPQVLSMYDLGDNTYLIKYNILSMYDDYNVLGKEWDRNTDKVFNFIEEWGQSFYHDILNEYSPDWGDNLAKIEGASYAILKKQNSYKKNSWKLLKSGQIDDLTSNIILDFAKIEPITLRALKEKFIIIEQSKNIIDIDISQPDAKLTYTIDNPEIVQVKSNGEVVGLKEGISNITVVAKKNRISRW